MQVLQRLQEQTGVNVLLACETGSRAWGFPSPDSDYDVRLIYMHESAWYSTLFEAKDSLEYMSDDGEIDLTGWELRKSLRLLCKSNASLLERLQSPIVYSENEVFMKKLRELVPQFYSKRTTLYHYLSLAKKSLALCADDEYRLKTFFYALRATCACRYIYSFDCSPPIVFQEMLDGIDMKDSLKTRILELVSMKANLSESYMHTGEQELIDWMSLALDQSEQEADSLEVSNADVKELDKLLFESIS